MQEDRRVLVGRIGGLGEIGDVDAEVDDLRVHGVQIGVQIEDLATVLVAHGQISAEAVEDLIGELGGRGWFGLGGPIDEVVLLEVRALVDPDIEHLGGVQDVIVVLIDQPLEISVHGARGREIGLAGDRGVRADVGVVEVVHRRHAADGLVALDIHLDGLDDPLEKHRGVPGQGDHARPFTYRIVQRVRHGHGEVQISRRIDLDAHTRIGDHLVDVAVGIEYGQTVIRDTIHDHLYLPHT